METVIKRFFTFTLCFFLFSASVCGSIRAETITNFMPSSSVQANLLNEMRSSGTVNIAQAKSLDTADFWADFGDWWGNTFNTATGVLDDWVNYLQTSNHNFWNNALGQDPTWYKCLLDGQSCVDLFNNWSNSGQPTKPNYDSLYRNYYDTNVYSPSINSTNYTQIFNPVTNTFNTFNNISNTWETNNINNYYYDVTNKHYTYVTNRYEYYVNYNYNYTYVNIIGNGESEGTHSYYFKLPDGSNSFNATPESIHGLKLDFQVSNYDNIADEDGIIGLYHLNGDYLDSSISNVPLNFKTSGFNSYIDLDNNFGSYPAISSLTVFSFPQLDTSQDFVLDFRVFLADKPFYLYFGDFSASSTDDIFLKKSTTHPTGTTYYDSFGYRVFTSSKPYLIFPIGFNDSVSFGYFKSGKMLGNCVFQSTSSAGYPKVTSSNIDSVCNAFDIYDSLSDYNKVQTYGDNRTSWYNPRDYKLSGSRGMYDNAFTNYLVNSNFTFNTYKNSDFTINYSYLGLSQYQWNSIRFVKYNDNLYFFSNGTLLITVPLNGIHFSNEILLNWVNGSAPAGIDEIRLIQSDDIDYSAFTSDYVISQTEFDTNVRYILPEVDTNNRILIQSLIPVADWQIGGVRKSLPVLGDVFIALDENNEVISTQQYDGGNWVEIPMAIYNAELSRWENLIGYSVVNDTFVKPLDPPDTGDGSDVSWSDLSKKLDEILAAINNGFDGISFGDIVNNPDTNLWDFLIALIENLVDGFASVFESLGNLLVKLLIPEDLSSFSNLLSTITNGFGVLGLPLQLVTEIFDNLIILTSGVTVPDGVISWNDIYVPGYDVVLVRAGSFNFQQDLLTNSNFSSFYSTYLTIIDMVIGLSLITMGYRKIESLIGGKHDN